MTERKRVYKKRAYPTVEEEGKMKEDEGWGEKNKVKKFTVEKVCKKNKFFPTEKTIGGFIPDFIKKSGKLIIEVEKEGRNSQERVNAFYRHGYKVLFLAKSFFTLPNSEEYITGSIKGFAR